MSDAETYCRLAAVCPPDRPVPPDLLDAARAMLWFRPKRLGELAAAMGVAVPVVERPNNAHRAKRTTIALVASAPAGVPADQGEDADAGSNDDGGLWGNP